MTKNELWEIWELAKQGNTYSRKPLPVEYVKEAEEYINGINSTIEKRQTSWSAKYPVVLLKEIGTENESIAKRILFVISQWRREGVIVDYYYMFDDIDIAVKIGYSLPNVIEESIIRFKKNLSVDSIEAIIEKLWKYYTDEDFAKFADNLFKSNINTLIEKKNESHMFFTLLITGSLLYKKDPVKYERYLKPIIDYAEKFAGHEDEAQLLKEVKQIAEDLEKDVVRELITIDKIRPDGRKLDEIRPLASEIGLLPRVHGSGLFTRGQTQALSACTLAPLGEHQIIDGLGVEESKRFIHHYNFPQFSVGSTGRAGSPGRREIGHGALGERALAQVIPSEEDFPYTIRLVAEVLESNGSSSQASICAGTLALMDAGVPIKAPVAGIAMGLVSDGENYTILTDIQGLEDHLGDMDFKVAGTKDGITALQMDIKIQGITEQILTEALSQAKKARMEILNELTSTIAAPREELSPYAPKIEMIQIDPAKIKDVIGKGGDTINGIIDETGVKIDIDQDGKVSIASSDAEMIKKAIKIIEDLTKEVKVGEVYLGKVVRVEKFGAFVNLIKGKDGLVHISQLANERVNKVEDVVKEGDEVLVKVTEIDKQGRINLSRKALLTDDKAEKK